MKTINKKLLLLASSIILFTNEIHTTRNNVRKKTNSAITQKNISTLKPSRALSATTSEKISGLTTSIDEKNKPETVLQKKPVPLQYLQSLQFEPEGRFYSLAYRTSILATLRNKKWEKPTDSQLLVGTLQTLDYAVQECGKYKKFDRLAEIIKLCFEKNITPNQAGLKVAHDTLKQEIDTELAKLRMLAATQSLIYKMQNSSKHVGIKYEQHQNMQLLKTIL